MEVQSVAAAPNSADNAVDGGGEAGRRRIGRIIFNLYAEYIMRNAGLEEAQAGIKTSGREKYQ